MGTFARGAAANETVAADAALGAWIAARDLGRESTRAELEELVRELATRPDLWGQDEVGPDGTPRHRTGDNREEFC